MWYQFFSIFKSFKTFALQRNYAMMVRSMYMDFEHFLVYDTL